MNTLRRGALAAIFLMFASLSIAFAQGPLQKKVNYTINVPHALRMGEYMLPPGRYVIYQISANDLNLFALYQHDMTRSPIAMIRTTRIEYDGQDHPGDTRLILNIDETSNVAHPVLRGWNIPGDDGWEIISVVASDRGVMTRIR